MSYENRRNLIDILKLDPNIPEEFEIIKNEYRAVDIDKVKIGGNTYTNYGAYSYILEKTYVKSPSRSASGSIGNLNSYATFLTGHLVIDFSIISIDDYRAIMRQHYEQNEYVVECYDPIYNITRTQKMYFATEEMAKLHIINRKIWNQSEWEDWLILAGVRDYKLEMISTNSDLSLVDVIYHLNPPESTGASDNTIGEPSVYAGQEIVIGTASDFQSETFGNGYKFKSWNTKADGGGLTYVDGYAYTINSNIVLYAQWDSATEHTLTYNYGLADPQILTNATGYNTSKKVVESQSIGELPGFTAPYVEITEGETKTKYYPYLNGAWYKIPVKTPNAEDFKLFGNELYWQKRDSTIYLLFDTKSYLVDYYIDRKLYQTASIMYNAPVPLPQLVSSMVDFDGWYTDETYTKKFSGNMPPYPISLYAKWVVRED